MNNTRPVIAIVDDEESVRRALERLFRSAGIEVETFVGGVEFLRSLDTHCPDCVVLDLHMPQMSGFDVLFQLAQSPGSVPVVAITGRDTEETHDRAIASGATAYLRKPVDGQALLDAVAAAVGGRRPKQGPEFGG